MNWKGLLFAAFLLLVMLANAGLGPLLSPLLYTLTPLQRHYLPAYIASSLKGSDPEATTEIRWVLKLKPKPAEAEPKPRPKPGKKGKGRGGPAAGTGHELGFADERDVAAKPVASTVWAGDAVPFRLSVEAEREGWTGLDWSVPQHAESGKLRDMLCRDYFGGERWWSFFMPPLFACWALLTLVLLTRAWLQGRRERHLWGLPRSRYDFLWRWALQPPRPAWETYEQPRRIGPARSAPRQIEAPRAPAPAVPQRETVTVEGSPRPAEAAAATPKAAYTWDASQGIE